MPRRRTLLLVTEGTSDANALAAPLQNLLNGVRIGDFQVRCDVTTARLFPDGFKREHGFTPDWNVGRTVDGLIDEYLIREGKSATSLGWIAHLTDLDGAFIPDSAVGQDVSLTHRAYRATGIISANREATLTQLAEKRRCIDLLVDEKTDFRRKTKKNEAWSVPYRLFYMSRNLEHALHGIVDDLSQDEKDDFASDFASANLDPAMFRRSLEQAAQRHGDMPDWKASWEYARDRSTCHSLESGSNLKWISDFVASCSAMSVRA
ncbi:hypothetical protein [Bifidobacterium aerophilum]|uniref:Uncharacterized protein n=1 Tax=Bifidobacterium aerophilum TaxID=1798155 RepID=A0A6N9Z5T1_9BIFI|nr:hypothetical protein [Bifidobacterium aerophilum]NEG89473.1 hypothetical protein [Bifidobacterium aerophilum]